MNCNSGNNCCLSCWWVRGIIIFILAISILPFFGRGIRYGFGFFSGSHDKPAMQHFENDRPRRNGMENDRPRRNGRGLDE